MRVLVLGATGHTGRLVCKKLVDRDVDVVAGVRRSTSRDVTDLGAAQIIDVDLEEDIQHAFEGIEKVIFAAGSGSKTGLDKTIAIDLNGALKCIALAEKFKIKRFVMLSSMGVETPELLPKTLRPYLNAKSAVDEQLRRSGLDHVIVRPARLTFGPATEMISAAPDVRLFTPISREDVAEIMVSLLLDCSIVGKTIELMGGTTPTNVALQSLVQTGVAA